MTLAAPVERLCAALGDPAWQAHGAHYHRWTVLFGGRARPLLVPAGGYRLQARCLPYFLRAGWRSVLANVLLRANALLPAARILPEVALPDACAAVLARGLPHGDPAYAAIQLGTPGPYQKAAMLLVSRSGEALALAKVALAPSADAMVAGEAAWLQRLASVRALAGRLPRLLAEGQAPTGRRYLVTTLAPSTAATAEFTPSHTRFLRALAATQCEWAPFPESPYAAHLGRALDALEPRLDAAAAALLRGSLRDCRAALDGWRGPFVIAQGDFVPWNIRLAGAHAFVFDWEYAHAGANPLADVWNFFLLQRALSRRPARAGAQAGLVRRIAGIAREVHPQTAWPSRVVAGLGLAYLVEVVLHYSRADGGLERRHPVMRHYLRLMHERNRWIAP